MVLPDREVLKTYRTPAIGFPETDASALNNTTIVAPTHKRAAATAATLTITNMIASENSDAVLPPSTPVNIPTTTNTPMGINDASGRHGWRKPQTYAPDRVHLCERDEVFEIALFPL